MKFDARSFVGSDQFSDRVMDVMGRVPRQKFVPLSQRDAAYENHPLPIGCEQTISQPYIVALMTDALGLGPQDRILEVGTGSGYQAAILSELVKDVYSIEVIKELADQARSRLKKLGYTNVYSKCGDGYYGWIEHAPYDGIIVTAVAEKIPEPLIEQLKVNGKMIIPVGSPNSEQELVLLEKNSRGKIHTQHLLPVRFVPLTGQH